MSKKRISSGIKELDDILNGGLIKQKSYLIKGGPGTGKSTLGYLFLEEGNSKGETTMLITLGESAENIKTNTNRLGIDLDTTHFLDLSPENLDFGKTEYSVFSPAEVETEPISDKIIQAIQEHKPDRVMIDSLTMLKYIYQNQFEYKNMALSLIRFVCSSGATLMMIAETHKSVSEEESEFWVDGVLQLVYGNDWRRIQVLKYRGSGFREGTHAMKINEQGLLVFPRLKPSDYDRSFNSDPISSGIGELDKMMHGGVEKGTISMITGPTGVGKTNLGIQFLKEAASRNERAVMYSFEESAEVIVKRSKLIGVPIDKMIKNGTLEIKSIEPFSYSPDEFSMMVRKDIEENGTKIVLLDSIGGYTLTVREENALERIHALCIYMSNIGVTGFLISETPNVTGDFVTTNLHASYLADNIIFLRYLELDGGLKKAIGILKKRLSDFENTIREYSITQGGISVGEPMRNLRGILSGNPELLKGKTS